MRAANILVFDEHILASSITTINQSWNERLGGFDQLAIMAVIDDVTGGSTGFKVQIEHSADGRLWINKSATAEIAPAGNLQTGQNALFGYDGGTIPNLGFVRLRIEQGLTTSSHVRVYVTGRMFGGR